MKENHIIIGLKELSNREVRSIVVVGKYGNSIHCTSRLILETFTKINNWQSLERQYTDIPKNVEENTILYVDGWFGMWNDDLCSVEKVIMACLSLIDMLKTTINVKIIIGMRSDLYKKYRQGLEEVDDQCMSLFRHKICLDTCDGRKETGYGNFFEKKIKTSCKKSKCACKILTSEMLLKGKDKVVGMPLKIRVMEKYHDIIPNYLDNCDLLKVMSDHFTSIEKEEGRRHVYEWIMYICMKGEFSRSGLWDTDLVKVMSFEIQQPSFDENDLELRRYVRMKNSDKQRNVSSENAHYVFWHPFIYICAFHSLFHKDPKFVMEYCNIDAIVQLVRPRGVETSYFEVAADEMCVTLFNKRIRRLGIKQEYAHHPLVKLFAGNEEV